jgi:hypothetical protein
VSMHLFLKAGNTIFRRVVSVVVAAGKFCTLF